MAAETITFKIGEDEYEVPEISDLDMDEWQVMYDYAGLVLDDFAPAEDEDEEAARIRRLRQPGFTRALLHIGYQRRHPEIKPEAVRELTGRAKLIPALQAIDAATEDEGDDADPPATTPEPAPLLPRSSGGSSESGPPPSETSSDQPDDHPVATGTTG